MALIKCAACGSEVSPEAAACPRCGQPTPGAAQQARTMAWAYPLALIAVAIGIVWFLAHGCQQIIHGG